MEQGQAQKAALEAAANALSYRSMSEQMLYDKLVAKGIGEREAAYAVSRLCELRLLDDVEYARAVCRSCQNKGYGATRARQKLRTEKLPAGVVEEVMAEYEPDYDKMAGFIRGKLQGKTADRATLKKVSDALMRRGFSWNEISHALADYRQQMEDIECL